MGRLKYAYFSCVSQMICFNCIYSSSFDGQLEPCKVFGYCSKNITLQAYHIITRTDNCLVTPRYVAVKLGQFANFCCPSFHFAFDYV